MCSAKHTRNCEYVTTAPLCSHGDHVCGCTTAHRALCHTHSIINAVIMAYGREAGFRGGHEPHASDIIHGVDPKSMSKLFTKRHNRATTTAAKEVRKTLADIHFGKNRAGQQQLVNAIVNAAEGIPDQNAGCDVRADSVFTPLNGKGPTILVDATIVHVTAKGARPTELHKLMKEFEEEERLRGIGLRPVAVTDNGPRVTRAVKDKHQRYGILVDIINAQVVLGTTALPAKFVAGAMSHRGELASELIDLIEYFAGRVKGEERGRIHLDGLTPAQASAKFRAGFKTRLFTGMATGWGRQMTVAGLPCVSSYGRRVGNGG